MSWISTLSATYDNCSDYIGKIPLSGEVYKTLLPIAHTVKLAQIEATIDREANLTNAKVLVDKVTEQPTIIPCSIESASRTSYTKPYALFDQIKYLAGDYVSSGGDVKYGECFTYYITQLDDWCNSEYSDRKVCLLRDYLKKCTLVHDLTEQKVFKDDEDISGLLVRFRVHLDGEERLWLDEEVRQSYIDYYKSTLNDMGLCYVSGNITQITNNHPKFIRSNRDGAKLISSQQDESGFGTKYKGYFGKVNEVISVGYETSEKAHNALRWLIARQGCQIGDFDAPLVYVAWGSSGEDVTRVTDDTYDLTGDDLLNEDFAVDFNASLTGYMDKKFDIDADKDIIIMGVDSAVPGRLSIVYYREFNGSILKERIVKWHTSTAWQQIKYVGDGEDTESGENEKFKRIVYVGAPSLTAIIKTAYGTKVDKKYIKSAMKRLVPCIYDGAVLPTDIVDSAVCRMSQRTALEDWEFRQGLGVVCAMIRKKYFDRNRNGNGKVWNMGLDVDENDRSYLFGRLLACAENAENRALYVSGDPPRQTNAERYQHQFVLKPVKTYAMLWERLQPYFNKLNPTEKSFTKQEMTGIYSKMDINAPDFEQKLDDIYLLGYSCQMMEINKRIEEAKAAREAKEAAKKPKGQDNDENT